MNTMLGLERCLRKKGVESSLAMLIRYSANAAKHVGEKVDELKHIGSYSELEAAAILEFEKKLLHHDVESYSKSESAAFNKLKNEVLQLGAEDCSELEAAFTECKEKFLHQWEVNIADFVYEVGGTINAVSYDGKYSVTLDLIDRCPLVEGGTMNVNPICGTIIGIHKGSILTKSKTIRDNVGRSTLVAAMYVDYAMDTMVYTVGEGVHSFYLTAVGDWVLSGANIQLAAEKPAQHEVRVYSIGGRHKAPSDCYLRMLKELEEAGYRERYEGALVYDINRVVRLRGGLYGYPAFPSQPQGRLRLLIESHPASLLTEQMNGQATDGLTPLLDISPKQLGQTWPSFFGGDYEMGAYVRPHFGQEEHRKLFIH